MGKSKYSFTTRARSFRFAINGLIHLFKSEVNDQIHLLAAILAIGMGLYFQIQTSEWLWVISAIALVIILEMVNTAIEEIMDLLHPDQNPKVGVIKDLVAGAVLISAIYASAVGLFIFGEPCLNVAKTLLTCL